MQFVIFGANSDYNDLIFDQNKDNILYLKPYSNKDNIIIKYLRKIHFSNKINNIFNLPLKKIWNKYYYKKINLEPDIFIFFPNWNLFMKNNFYNYLKKRYPQVKFVLFCRDLIETYQNFNINFYKEKFDLVLTYDKKEAQEYNINYYPQIFNKIDFLKNNIQKSDLFFVGKSKNRLNKILNIYEFLNNKQFDLDFNIVDVNKEKQLYKDSINYNKRLPYTKVLKKVSKTNCILEVVQKKSSGLTLRALEALFYNKKLLTNNNLITEEKFYNDKYIQVFDKISNIDEKFLKNDIKVNYSNKLKQKYTLDSLLDFIKNKVDV